MYTKGMKTIVCFGDSNTYGYNPADGGRYPKSVRWPGRLTALLGEDFTVIEEGCNGRTTMWEDPLEPWKSGLPYLTPCLNSHKPVDLLALMLGSNDLKRIYDVTPEEIAGGAERLVAAALAFGEAKQKVGPRVLLISPPEITEGITDSPFSFSFDETAPARSRALAPLYRAVAEKYGCLFLNAAEVTEPSPLDCLHLTPESHAALAEAVAKIIPAEFGDE